MLQYRCAGAEDLTGGAAGSAGAGTGRHAGRGGPGGDTTAPRLAVITVSQVCPVILQLTEADSVDDYRTEAVALIAKMAPLIGKLDTERIFLDR